MKKPHNIRLSAGQILHSGYEHGWRHPLFHIRFLIWEWDPEIDYSEPEKPSEFQKLILSIRKAWIGAKKSVNT